MSDLGVNEKKNESDENPLLSAAREGSMATKLKQYLKSCRPPPDADPKKDIGRLANMAGFCAWLGCGISALEELKREFPPVFDYLCAVMEDEALNSGRSPALLNTYLKERCGFGEKQEGGAVDIRPVFEHDILEDGI